MISWGQDHAKKEAALRERLAHEEETRRKARGNLKSHEVVKPKCPNGAAGDCSQ